MHLLQIRILVLIIVSIIMGSLINLNKLMMKMISGILKLEDLVRLNEPLQILQLILQEQVDKFMEEEIINANDYVDWLRWVSYAEQSRQAMYESTHCAKFQYYYKLTK